MTHYARYAIGFGKSISQLIWDKTIQDDSEYEELMKPIDQGSDIDVSCGMGKNLIRSIKPLLLYNRVPIFQNRLMTSALK